ncbi:response regulator transcription factor [Arcobacter aquimarinus]|uniref:Two-component system response regulator n=1 Tax=Arcobacter aquimarinus TaxID=1315211 RepID=A0AAE7E0M7_9BACT|nr:response regulator transcription factor [Arcobacter aquimarinus]QKE25012.1 two-component system response regulator [Arcobacter aquimarinus]RXI31635.1 transcriptional regulator [Arcobacter aquimarinus]
MSITNQYVNILKKLNILYIEDEENIKLNVKKTLLLFSDNVFDAEDIASAKKILHEKRIDIILSDINLPDKSGIDFIKEIRLIDKKIPIIILSAYTDKKFLLEATKLKLIDYLTKPIDFKSLNQALNKCVDEILDNSRYIISFKNNINYNVLHKKLIDTEKEEELSLTSKELTLLDFLIKNSNRIVSSEELKSYLWEDEYEATDSALKNLLNKLRKKVGKDSIINTSGVGYRLDY